MGNSRNCLNCGAPVTTEVCPYCHAITGLDSSESVMEYPVIDCKEANISFWTFIFPMIFAVSFGFFGFFFPVLFFLSGADGILQVVLFSSIFGIIGVVALVITIKPVIRYLLVKTRGKLIEATVYGYMDDNLLINGFPAQIVKLLVNTDDGYKFILYQLGDTKQIYRINSKIELIAYKDLFLISKKKKYYF